MIPIREALKSWGVSSADIGWDGESVTYKGRQMIKPAQNIEGVTYDDQERLKRALAAARAELGEIVPARDYLTQKAYSLGFVPEIKWNDDTKTASLGGINIPYEHNADGTIFSDPGALDKVLSAAYPKNAQSARTAAPAEFKYNPSADPSLAAYKNYLDREGKKAAGEAFSDFALKTGGVASSAAGTAAETARQEWQNRLLDIIPALEKQAFDRYMAERKQSQDEQARSAGEREREFERAYRAARDGAADEKYAAQMKMQQGELEYQKERGRLEMSLKLLDTLGEVVEGPMAQALGIKEGTQTAELKRQIMSQMANLELLERESALKALLMEKDYALKTDLMKEEYAVRGK